MSCNCAEGPSVITELIEHLALELRFTLGEFELHEASEAIAALQHGVTFLQKGGHAIPYVVTALIDDAAKNRH